MSDTKTIVVQQIPLSLIKPNPHNRLITQDAIDAMAESLDTLGLINAIKVRPLGDSTYMVFSGHIRRAGAIKLGWETIACIVSDKNAKEATIEGIWDNRQNTQTWLDDCKDIENLLNDDPNLTIEQLGKILRTSESDIKRGKRLLKCLNPASRALIDQNLKKPLISSSPTWPTQEAGKRQSGSETSKSWELTLDPVYRLTDLEDPEAVFKALQVVIDQQLTGPKTTALVNHLKAGQPLEAFNPHKPVPKEPKVSAPAPLPAELADRVVELRVPAHHTHPAHLSPSGDTASPTAQSAGTPATSTKVYMFKDWLAGVKVIPQLKHKVQKGQNLTFVETMVLGAYRLGEGLRWLWKEILKPMLKSMSEGLKKTLGKGLYNFILLVLVCFVLWKVWNVFHIGFHPINWIESKFHGESKPAEDSAPVPTPQPQTPISMGLGQPKPVTRHEASKQVPVITYEPAVSFAPTASTQTLYDPKILESEILSLPRNCIVKDYPMTPDEGMPGDLAVSRMQDLTNPDKYTMKIGDSTEKILSVSPSHTTLTVAYQSADPLGGLVDGSGPMNIFWEDVKTIHINEVNAQTATPSVFYQCSLIVSGAKYPLTIQCASSDDLEHLVSTMEYFIRSSRLAHDAQPAGLPYPHQGLVLDGNRTVEKLWADSPMDKAGVALGDHLWSVGKVTSQQQGRTDLEAGLQTSAIFYLVAASEWQKALTVARAPGQSNGFRPKLRKIILTI